MKKECAIFTVVKNEKLFMPIWYSYYSKFFYKEDIYILDNNTDDGSLDSIDCNITKIQSEFDLDYRLLTTEVTKFQQTLLKEYQYVVYTDIDEIIFNIIEPDLRKYISSLLKNKTTHVTCTAFEIYHDIENGECNYNSEKKILDQRNLWFRYPFYDKTLISSVPCSWVVGFHHTTNLAPNQDPNLVLLHLHRFDYNSHRDRKISFQKLKFIKNGDGSQNKLKSESEIHSFFHSEKNKCEIIPEFIPHVI